MDNVFLCITGGTVFVVLSNGRALLIGPASAYTIGFAKRNWSPFAVVRPRETRLKPH